MSLDKFAARSVVSMLAFIDKQLVKIRAALSEIVKQSEQLKTQIELLTSIDGVGDKTAWAILAYIGDISLFKNAKQVSSHAGLNPRV